jgi:cytochrome b
MMPSKENAKTAGRMDFAKVNVWDFAVRLFHWSLVLLVATTAITGLLSPEWWLDIHVLAGLGIGLLLSFRIIWGFVGSHYARFASFRFSFQELADHVRNVLTWKGGQYLGHNPAGALMVFALIFVLAGLTISGFVVLGGQENQGMLAAFANFQSGHVAREMHEFMAFLLLAMIGAHIAGVIVEMILNRDNLIRAMFTGQKQVKATGHLPADSNERRFIWRAPLVFIAILAITGPAYWFLASLPASGFVEMKKNASWASECGDCHITYHPSLLPRSSWQQIMAGLNEHFGEDASLDDKTREEITTFLSTYASEVWDSEAANELRIVDTRKPLQITAAPYWIQRHGDIKPETFKRKAIGSKGNCLACHKDAVHGRFADEKISIPEQTRLDNKGEKR